MFLWSFGKLYLGEFANHRSDCKFSLSSKPVYYQDIVKKTEDMGINCVSSYLDLTLNLKFELGHFSHSGVILNKAEPISKYVDHFAKPRKNLDDNEKQIAEVVKRKLLALESRGVRL